MGVGVVQVTHKECSDVMLVAVPRVDRNACAKDGVVDKQWLMRTVKCHVSYGVPAREFR